TPDPEWARPDPDRMEKFLALRRMNQELKQARGDKQKELEEKRREMQREQRQTQQQHLLELRGWWLERMAKAPRPLQEKLTLFWHGHFATSVQKVKDAYFMWLQNRVQQKFEYRSAIHDPGIKTVLGRSGNLTGSDVLEQIAGHPQAARFICAKLWTFFAAENPTDELVSALADTFRRGNSYFRP